MCNALHVCTCGNPLIAPFAGAYPGPAVTWAQNLCDVLRLDKEKSHRMDELPDAMRWHVSPLNYSSRSLRPEKPIVGGKLNSPGLLTPLVDPFAGTVHGVVGCEDSRWRAAAELAPTRQTVLWRAGAAGRDVWDPEGTSGCNRSMLQLECTESSHSGCRKSVATDHRGLERQLNSTGSPAIVAAGHSLTSATATRSFNRGRGKVTRDSHDGDR